jgi:hypothetical protein
LIRSTPWSTTCGPSYGHDEDLVGEEREPRTADAAGSSRRWPGEREKS